MVWRSLLPSTSAALSLQRRLGNLATCRHGYIPSTNATIRRHYYDDETNMNGSSTSSSNQRLSEQEQALYNIAKPKLEAYRMKHISMPDLNTIPKASLYGSTNDAITTTGVHDQTNDTDELYIRKKRLIYRCMQRGWLEVDLLLGTWAKQNVFRLSTDELDEFETFVNMETIDIYNIMTLRVVEIEDDGNVDSVNSSTTKSKSIIQQIQSWVKSNPLGKADPEKYKELKETMKLI